MKIVHHADIEKDFKALKRFPAPKESLESWERLFCAKGLRETPAIEQYPGFGTRKIYKARLIPLKENVGKSQGYRAIFEIKSDGSQMLCLVLVFSRHGIYKSEKELFWTIKNRME